MRRMPVLICCFLSASVLMATTVLAQTYYVRTDGGDSTQCTGTADTSYPGSGTEQSCAWSHPFWALDASGQWNIQGGDTLVIGPGSYMMGYGAPNTSGWCDTSYAYTCVLPALPSGPDALHPTRVLGRGWASGCADPPELWGTEKAYSVFSLEGTSNAEINCLELTDHSGCVESHSNPAVSCERVTYPYGLWGSLGIYAADSSNVVLRNLDVHGFADGGVRAGRLTDWTLEKVRLAANGWVGWDGDIDGADSNSGTLSFREWTVEWNGCAETWPGEQPEQCWAQTAGGYGDGVGTGPTGGHWIIQDSSFRYNTSDGLDLYYAGVDTLSSQVEIKRTEAYGNAGNQVKIAGPAEMSNCLMIGNCGFFNGQPFTYNVDDCRAMGNTLALALYQGNTSAVINSTIVGEGDILAEVECRDATCDGSEAVYLQNNVFRGYTEFLAGGGELATLLLDPSGFTTGLVDYNVIYNVKNDPCPMGGNDLCSDPSFADSALPAFDGHLQDGSPARDSGMVEGSLDGRVPANDIEGITRPLGSAVDRGAYEYGASAAAPPQPSWIAADDGVNSDRIVISWEDVSGETGYRLYRASSAGGPYTLIGSTGPDTTSAENGLLSCGNSYYYHVSAFGPEGESRPSVSDLGYTEPCSGTLLFSDDFSDGTLKEIDPEWDGSTPGWKVRTLSGYEGGNLYRSSLVRRRDTALAKEACTGTVTSGRFQANFKFGRTLARRRAGFLFNNQGTGLYRGVVIKQKRNKRWRMLLLQAGDYDGDIARVAAQTGLASFKRRVWHKLDVDIYADGNVNVYLDDVLVLQGSFTAPSGGRVGVFSRKTRVFIDNVNLWDQTGSPPG